MSGENVKTDQASNQDPGAWGDFDNFAGERNINDKTGKERTFSEFDVYPRQPGESSEEYGKRLKEMHEKTAKYLAEQAAKEEASKAITNAQGLRTEEYVKSDFGQKELKAEADYDRIADKLERAVQEGRMTKDHADKLLERKLNSSIKEIDGIRQDFEDSKTVGPEEDQEAYEKWLIERGFKEEPKAKEPIVAEDKPAEEAPKDAEVPKNTEELNANADVISEAKERLMKELGPIIYDNVMAIIAGEFDRIFSEVKVVPINKEQAVIEESVSEEVVEEPKNKSPEAEKTRTKEAVLAELNEIRAKRGETPFQVGNPEALRAELNKSPSNMTSAILDIVEMSGSQIGGQKGIDILTNTGAKDTDAYGRWWNSLDESGQKKVRQILTQAKELDQSGTGLNQNFLSWLDRQDEMKSLLNNDLEQYGAKVA